MTLDKKQISQILSKFNAENSNNNIAHYHISDVRVNDNNIVLDILTKNPTLQFKQKVQSKIADAILEKYPDFNSDVNLEINFLLEDKTVKPQKNSLSNVKNMIAIASGKGGVGKSTVSSNLAVALKNKGYSVGLIDADIYGPSIPLMFDAQSARPKQINKGNQKFMVPIESYGIKIMSIGFFSDSSEAVVWRGPMATKALTTIINQTDWGELDYLLIDLPPGTSDIHLSLVQTIPLTGAIVITTPQPVSLLDASKAISMFKLKEINVPVLGLIENMSWYETDGVKHYIFGRDGGKNLADSKDIPLLAEIPLNQSIREACDIGRPAALQESDLAVLFLELAELIKRRIDLRNNDLPKTKKVEITHNRGCN